jgi:hypothetical protein
MLVTLFLSGYHNSKQRNSFRHIGEQKLLLRLVTYGYAAQAAHHYSSTKHPTLNAMLSVR